MNDRNNQVQEKGSGTQQNDQTSTKQPTGNDQEPGERLNDGTNDYQNGDQDESSETSSKPNS